MPYGPTSAIHVLSQRWDLFLPLLASHFIVDFPLQPASWVRSKSRGLSSPILFVHCLLAGLLAYLLVGAWRAWWLLPAVFLSHLVIDAIKSRFPDGALSFLLDQLVHWLTLAVFVLVLDRGAPQGQPVSPFWILFVAWLLIWWVEGTFIGKATARWRRDLENKGEGELADAGLWIGRLERSLILLFVLAGRLEAIGFLIAAKSIFRFKGGDAADRRKEAEYVLIGTMASFLLALLTGFGALTLMG